MMPETWVVTAYRFEATDSNVNKDFSYKDEDQVKDLWNKDQDKDKEKEKD